MALLGHVAQRPDSAEIFLVAADHRGCESLKVAPVAGKLELVEARSVGIGSEFPHPPCVAFRFGRPLGDREQTLVDGSLIRNSQSADKSAHWPIRNQDLALPVGQTHAVDGRVDQPAQKHRVPFQLLLRQLQLRDVDDETLTMGTLALVDQVR